MMLFADFSTCLANIEKLSSRLEMTKELVSLMERLKPTEAHVASYVLLGELRPAHEAIEFSLSIKMVLRALAKCTTEQAALSQTDLFGETTTQQTDTVEQLYKQLGDIGAVAEQILVQNAPSTPLTITTVYDCLLDIAHVSGTGSQDKKLSLLVELLQQLDAVSAKFVCRMVVGKMRLGFSTMTLLDAVSWMFLGDKSGSKALEDAWQKKADIGQLIEHVLTAHHNSPITTLEQLAQLLDGYTVSVGVPVVPQLCQRLPTPQEVIEKLHQVIMEPKYDGLRVQIHIDKRGGKTLVKAFSRSLEDITEMFPELYQVARELNCQSVILDSEAIGIDPATDNLRPFQETMTRKRKHDIADQAESIPIRFFVYDILSLNEQELLLMPLQQRKKLLQEVFIDSAVVQHAPFVITDDANKLDEFHTEQLAAGLEGAVVKQIDSPYQSGRKGWYWVKMKEKAGEFGKLTDTVDAVVMGYYVGRGKRTQFGLGAILVGIIDSSTTEDSTLKLLTIAKIGTGMTEQQLQEMKQRLDSHAASEKPSEYVVTAKALIPDVWMSPQVVVEIAADEITTSPVHSAGKALRFPRLIKFRDDKSWSQATTTEELATIQVAG